MSSFVLIQVIGRLARTIQLGSGFGLNGRLPGRGPSQAESEIFATRARFADGANRVRRRESIGKIGKDLNLLITRQGVRGGACLQNKRTNNLFVTDKSRSTN